MDFGELLTVAQKNSANKQKSAYSYPAKFRPPKKESKQSKALSDNIKKFLAKKEEEDRRKALDEKRKKENLLALRDHKAQSRINKHLKVCKAANKSVIADAVNYEDTAVTIAGPSQPDEDDYGYVSQEASAFYNKLMSKYNNVTTEKPVFCDSGKKTFKDITSTKDRVKEALKQHELEESLPHRRKRKSSSIPDKNQPREKQSTSDKDRDRNRDRSDKTCEKEEKSKMKKRTSMPPPIDFMSLLKLAERKQHEPLSVELKPKPRIEEPERLMTKRQMKEYQKEKEWKEKREREKSGEVPKGLTTSTDKISVDNKSVDKSKAGSHRTVKENDGKSLPSILERSLTKVTTVGPIRILNRQDKSSFLPPKLTEKEAILEERKKLEAERREVEIMRKKLEEEKRLVASYKEKSNEDSGNKSFKINEQVEKPLGGSKDVRSRLSCPTDTRPKKVPPKDFRSKQFPSTEIKPRQWLSDDIRGRSSRLTNNERPMNKRRIYDDEDEYDSDLDDFIDDGPEEGAEDYSKYISEIFGYDKNRYNACDDDDDNMESNYAQQLKEEFVSTKIGIMEDLEDMKQEALEKKRKSRQKKKVKK